jgi:hypothetical protein
MQALALLKEMNTEGLRAIPKEAPIGFVTPRWQKYVLQSGGIDRRYYELCVLNELRGRLRAGDVWVVGSKQYRDFEDYLLPPGRWNELVISEGIPVAVETNIAAYLKERGEVLHEALSTVDTLIANQKLADIKLVGSPLKISPLKMAVPEGVEALRRQVYAKLPRINLSTSAEKGGV